ASTRAVPRSCPAAPRRSLSCKRRPGWRWHVISTTSPRQAADKGPSASLAPSAAGSTYREYASPAAFGRRLASGPFSAACRYLNDRAGRVGARVFTIGLLDHSHGQGGASMSLRLGDTAPDFTAESTEGPIRFHEWVGDKWAILFSHPKDFIPLCTTELGYVAVISHTFHKRGGMAW